MAFKRYADARWQGDLQAGSGSMSTPQSGLFADQSFSFKTRFGDQAGTNPEELLAAAHAGCFSMALSAVLGKAGFVPEEIRTERLVVREWADDDAPAALAVFGHPEVARWLAGSRIRAAPSSSTGAAAPTSFSCRSRWTRLTLGSACPIYGPYERDGRAGTGSSANP